MQNAVPTPTGSLALRSLAERQASYLDEVRRFLKAGIAVMQRQGTVAPRVSEVVKEAGLSNQAFYRHFASKDDFLLAILDDGLRQLLDFLEARMASEAAGEGKVRRWIEGILAQAGHPKAAEATRPFAANSLRLAHRFPQEAARSTGALTALLQRALEDVPGADPARDAESIYHLTMGAMQGYLVRGERPSRRDVQHVVDFALAGLSRGGEDGARGV